VTAYLAGAHQLAASLRETGGPVYARDIRRGDVEGFITDLITRLSPSTASVRYRALQQWSKWMLEEEELDRSPMERMEPPHVPEVPVPTIGDDHLEALLATSTGTDFVSRRDNASLRVFLDTGMRVSELAGLTVVKRAAITVTVRCGIGRSRPGGDEPGVVAGVEPTWTPSGGTTVPLHDDPSRAVAYRALSRSRQAHVWVPPPHGTTSPAPFWTSALSTPARPKGSLGSNAPTLRACSRPSASQSPTESRRPTSTVLNSQRQQTEGFRRRSTRSRGTAT
jgi:hypothetical protein